MTVPTGSDSTGSRLIKPKSASLYRSILNFSSSAVISRIGLMGSPLLRFPIPRVTLQIVIQLARVRLDEYHRAGRVPAFHRLGRPGDHRALGNLSRLHQYLDQHRTPHPSGHIVNPGGDVPESGSDLRGDAETG